jgi:hypothetical protein
MPNVSFANIRLNQRYSRNELAQAWGYESATAISKGVVTPRGQSFIILFVTRDQQPTVSQYRNYLEGNRLTWEGPKDHSAEDRMLAATRWNDEIHLFYRERHHSDFTYLGRLTVENVTRHRDRPSEFVLRLVDTN